MSILVHIDIPADNLEKANDFYLKLFGRKVEKVMGHVEGPDEDIGNISGSKDISSYIGVYSIEEYIEKIESLGGKALTSKMVVQGWGYLAICMDNANNIFNLWEKSLIPDSQPEWLSSSP
ncbi:MAG: Glyoxalase-like domain protein [Methanomethylovorans sp. PtaU1.Bin073]|jgi:predicted enzyme related to lactoylglutathione lyase|nr:MAG: Glyoxalase-like domain protein [Methanomethylovorans sp. PtaU1.Bin073]